jgi:hypothetical protein
VRRGLAAVLALLALHAAASAWVLHVGFTHVSDDDYARTTIAQAFAHAPRLDPSGTSWLPFPFWLSGTVMAVLGRSLAVARGVAIATSALGSLLVYGALLRAGVSRQGAVAGVALAVTTPWTTWLGVATVPEALTATLVVGGVLTLSTEDPKLRLIGATGLLAASLSRYEAWPVAATFAVACLVRAFRPRSAGDRWLTIAAAVLALLGPTLWIVWNEHAHGNPLHFFGRVARFRMREQRGADASLLGGLGLYVGALLRASPCAVVLAGLGAVAFFYDRALRARWWWPLSTMAALGLFLVAGEAGNGAPTHHPERALLSLFWVLSLFGADGVFGLASRFVRGHPRREAWAAATALVAGATWMLAWAGSLSDCPGRSAAEDRTKELARGAELREAGASHLTVTPCAYEHFALIAAFEAPERVTVLPAPARPGLDCPRVEITDRQGGGIMTP